LDVGAHGAALDLEPPVSQFDNPATRVRINPETYLKFDGTEMVMLQNVHSPDAFRIKYDIMLILFSIVDWATVGELIEPWPPDDQQKIIQHLNTLYQTKVIVVDEGEIKDLGESGMSSALGADVYINAENHYHMLKDYVRTASYRRAIERAVTPGTVAMDLGSGSGVLGFFAARAGAQKVYAIEKRPDILALSQQIAEKSGITTVDFIEGNSSQIPASRFDPKPDLLIAEILGHGILNERVIEFTLDARDRFLAPGGTMIPSKLDLYAFAYEEDFHLDIGLEVAELDNLYGFNFEPLAAALKKQLSHQFEYVQPLHKRALADPVNVHTLDFTTLNALVFSIPFTVVPTRDGHLSGFCCYFNAFLDATTTVTNSPWAPKTTWTQYVAKLHQPLPVVQGQSIKLRLIYDGNLRISWDHE
jgi:2-polyprenyl-3-methyl-5-hydroxy-6-metoxy-1,4-benzoquinol methylase